MVAGMTALYAALACGSVGGILFCLMLTAIMRGRR